MKGCARCGRDIGPGINGTLCRVCIWTVEMEIPRPRIEPRRDDRRERERREREEAVIRDMVIERLPAA